MSAYYFGFTLFLLLSLFLIAFGLRIIWIDRKREEMEKQKLKESKSH